MIPNSHPATFTEVPAPSLAVPGGLADCSARIPRPLGANPDYLSTLNGLSVAVIGAGSIGSAVAEHLARMQVSALFIVDRSFFKPESLITQAILPAAFGQPKAVHVAQTCKAISPGTRVFYCHGDVQTIDPLDLLRVDVILAATDNLSAELDVSQKGIFLRTPVIYGAVLGEALLAQVRVVANRTGQEACLACGFNSLERQMLAAETRFSCTPEAGSDPSAPAIAGQSTFSFSALCALAASLMILQMIKLMLGFGRPVADTVTELCGHNFRTFVNPLARNEECPCQHTPCEFLWSPKPLPDASPAWLADNAGLTLAEEDPLLFAVHGLIWVDCLRCRNGHDTAIHRFLPAGQTALGSCAICGDALSHHPLGRREFVAAQALGPRIDLPLRDLGAEAASRVVIRTPSAAILYRSRHS